MKMEIKYGIFSGHQYHIADIYEANNKKIIKIQNPHNIVDKIKK
jgi:hypothetical protein